MSESGLAASPDGLAVSQLIMKVLASSEHAEGKCQQLMSLLKQLSSAEAVRIVFNGDVPAIDLDKSAKNLTAASKAYLELGQRAAPGVQFSDEVVPADDQAFTHYLLAPYRAPGALTHVIIAGFDNKPAFNEEVVSVIKLVVDGINTAANEHRLSRLNARLMQNQYEFVRIMTHNLRTDLTVIKGYSDFLNVKYRTLLDDTQRTYLGRIVGKVEEATKLVDKIQNAGRYDPEAGFYKMRREPTDVITLVEQIARKVINPQDKQGITVTVDVARDIPLMDVDGDMLEHAIENLIDNAFKYTPDGGNVAVRAAMSGDDLIISVADDGPGISEENLKRLFQKYYQVKDHPHVKTTGSGLGLFIVRSVALHHDGDAWVESEEGQGSTFKIRIPLSEANHSDDAEE